METSDLPGLQFKRFQSLNFLDRQARFAISYFLSVLNVLPTVVVLVTICTHRLHLPSARAVEARKVRYSSGIAVGGGGVGQMGD